MPLKCMRSNSFSKLEKLHSMDGSMKYPSFFVIYQRTSKNMIKYLKLESLCFCIYSHPPITTISLPIQTFTQIPIIPPSIRTIMPPHSPNQHPIYSLVARLEVEEWRKGEEGKEEVKEEAIPR